MLIKLYLDNEINSINEVFLGQAASVFLSCCSLMIRSETSTQDFNFVRHAVHPKSELCGNSSTNPRHVNVVPNSVHVSTSATEKKVLSKGGEG